MPILNAALRALYPIRQQSVFHDIFLFSLSLKFDATCGQFGFFKAVGAMQLIQNFEKQENNWSAKSCNK
jgi:hypothetical protein